MKHWILLAGLALITTLTVQAQPGYYGGPRGYGGYYVYQAPPPPPPPPVYVYQRPPWPGPNYVWIDGYWNWSGNRYAWRGGYWGARPYANAYWVTPRYYGGRYYTGYWGHRRHYR